MLLNILFFFFFSSRRRHTRLQGDWSSDVCSSDLCGPGWSWWAAAPPIRPTPGCRPWRQIGRASCRERVVMSGVNVSSKKKDIVIEKSDGRKDMIRYINVKLYVIR